MTNEVSILNQLRVSHGSNFPIDFSLWSLFDRTITNACPVASESFVEVGLPSGVGYTIIPEPHAIRGETALYDTRTGELVCIDGIYLHFS